MKCSGSYVLNYLLCAINVVINMLVWIINSNDQGKGS